MRKERGHVMLYKDASARLGFLVGGGGVGGRLNQPQPRKSKDAPH